MLRHPSNKPLTCGYVVAPPLWAVLVLGVVCWVVCVGCCGVSWGGGMMGVARGVPASGRAVVWSAITASPGGFFGIRLDWKAWHCRRFVDIWIVTFCLSLSPFSLVGGRQLSLSGVCLSPRHG